MSGSRRRRAALAWGASLVALAAAPAAVAAPGAAPATSASAEEELVLALRADRSTLSDGLPALTRGGALYLPLGELARALDFPIVVQRRRASGWFVREERRFVLDLDAGWAVVGGRTLPLPPDGVLAREGDLYVRADLLEAWFPLTLKAELAASVVTVIPSEPLPFQERLARENRAARAGGGEPAALDLPVETTPYRWVTPPSVDVNLHATTGDPRQSTYDLRLAGDLGKLSADLYVGGDGVRALGDVRLVVGRSDPRGIGVLGLTLAQAGDVFTPELPNGLRSVGGRGVMISNETEDSAVLLDRTDVRGELPLGWQAELYRNGVLIGSQLSAANGRYEFLDVKLGYGLNTLKVVLYGPRGERREVVRQLRLGQETLAPGRFRFRAGAVQADTPLFDTGRRSRLLSGYEPIDRGGVQAALLAEYGLARNLTLAGHIGARPSQGRTDLLAGLGLRTSLRGATLRIDGDVVDDGSSALSAAVLGRAFGVDLALEHAEYAGGFRDDRRSFDNNVRLRSATTLRADSLLHLRGGFDLPLSLEVEHRKRLDGGDDLLATARTSVAIRGVLISQSLRYQHRPYLDGGGDELEGDLAVNTGLAGGLARLTLNYAAMPDGRLQTASLSWDRYLGPTLALRTELSQGLDRGGSTRAQVGLTKRFARLDATVEAGYDTSREEALLGLRLSTSFGWNGRGYAQLPPGFATGGGALVSVYQDRNADGVRQPDEPPVAGIKVVAGGGRSATTGADGTALVGGLGPGRIAEVLVAPGSIEDPFLRPTRPGFAMLPRPGRIHASEIGLIATAEVETSVVFEEMGRPVSNVSLALVDAQGRSVAEARSEYDGFALLQGVPPGRYRLTLGAEQARQLGLVLAEEPEVIVPPSGGELKAPKLRVRRAAATGALSAAASTFVFRDVRLKNATALSPAALAKLVKPYRGRVMGLADVRALAIQIEDAYQALGYPFVVVVAPPQTVSDGVVDLEVVEGRISGLTVLGLDPTARRQTTAVFNGLVDRTPLSLEEAEAAYARARAIPGLTVAGALRRGDKPGGMDLVLQSKRQTWRVYGNVNNLYPDPVGPWGALLIGEYNGASTYGDQTTLQLFSTTDFEEQKLARLVHTRRFNAWGTGASVSFLAATANPGGAIAPLDLATDVLAGRVEVSQPIAAARGWSVLTAVALDWTDQQTRIFSRDLNGPLTEDRLRTLLVRASGDWVRPDREVHLSAEVRKGLDVLGASRKGALGLSRDGADPQALVVRASASGEIPLGWRVRLNLRAEGQWTPDSLTAPDEFTVGSLTIGRGYQPASSYGDSAAAVAIEPRLGPFRFPHGISVAPYGFFDAARVWNRESGAPDGRWVRSAGLGVRVEVTGRGRLDLGYAVPLDAPLGLGEPRPEPRWLVNFTASLTDAASTLRQVAGAFARPAPPAPRR